VALVLLALIAANWAVIAEASRAADNLRSAWIACGVVLGTNGLLCALLGLVLRFRLLPLMGIFTVAALTEAVLWRVAASGRNPSWIALVAIVGACLLAVFGYRLDRVRRTRQRDTEDRP
jgi:hypothetical protein